MLRLIVFAFLMMVPHLVYAAPQCSSLHTKDQALMSRVDKLFQTHRESISLFGFSYLMVKQRDVGTTAGHVVRVEGLMKGCQQLLDKQTCKKVSEDIIDVLSQGLILCTSDQQFKCGVCS